MIRLDRPIGIDGVLTDELSKIVKSFRNLSLEISSKREINIGA